MVEVAIELRQTFMLSLNSGKAVMRSRVSSTAIDRPSRVTGIAAPEMIGMVTWPWRANSLKRRIPSISRFIRSKP
ncbi:hypothetical protein D3C80_2156130 [compost metagenome]